MSSSSSQFHVSRPATYFPSARYPSVYRQTDYHGEQGVQVVESRRSRSHVTPMTPSTQKTHALAPTSPRKGMYVSSKTSKTLSGPSRESTPHRKHTGHVTPKPKSSMSRGKVVIVQGDVSVAVDFGQTNVAIGLATPPPTPKMRRLATPELEDIEERPFCDCCTGVQVARYCAACGWELHGQKG